MKTPRLFLLSASVALLGSLATAQTLSSKLTIDDLIKIKHPSGHQWTPDGSHVWFTYDDGGINNIWAVPADGGSSPAALTNYPDGQLGGGFWSRDGKTFFFQRGGGLQSMPVNGGTPQPAWPSAANAAGFTLSPDGTKIAFVTKASGGGADLMVHTIAAKTDQRITRMDGGIGAVSWSLDGTKLAYSASSGDGTRGGSDLVVANLEGSARNTVVHQDGPIAGTAWSPDGAYLTYNTGGGGAPGQIHTSPPEIGAKIIFVTNTGRGGNGGGAFVVPVGGGTPRPIRGGGGGRGGGGNNWLDATHQLTTNTSSDGKTRSTESIDIIKGGEPKVLHTETEDKFFSAINTTAVAISPDRRWLLFTSDATGWDQIYVMPASGGAATQITKTPGDHWRAVWSHDSQRIAWDTNTADKPGDRQIEIATIGADPAHATLVTVTSGDGTNTIPEWSPDDKRILYQHTDAQNSADLFVAAASANARPIRLTSSIPSTVDRSIFVAPQLVHYPGPDGKSVPAWLFVPKNLDRSKLHAALVWIHPDGVNQSYNGWHPVRNEAVYYEFHQYLLQQGYVVIAPDYRGSIGYGRDWRNDVYMDVGGNDAKDARMAAGYLKTLGYVDPERIGVWGLSYGGFFTLLAVTQEPALFRAAVDVAGVVDYKLYYEDPYHGGWTTSRIGTPEEHPDVYAKADPMSHVDQIQCPLLVLAGTADVNVPFIESALLVDKLLKAGKGDLVTFMMYPGEFHYFDRSFVVRDAWQRVDAFFALHLHPNK
jgi:dipeptidyl aminopeptidase/acylaminoacyl peptidase